MRACRRAPKLAGDQAAHRTVEVPVRLIPRGSAIVAGGIVAPDAVPAPWEGLIWGILPIGSSILAILFVLFLIEPRRVPEQITIPAETPEGVYDQGVRL